MMKKFRCGECGAVHEQKELLTAPNPFDINDTISGCPSCRSACEFTQICDEPGCANGAGCGWPSDSGYRRTCFKHSKFA